MLKHNFEFWKIAAQWNELRLNENCFAVKQINVAAGHFTVNQQEHAHFLHGSQCGVNLFQIGDARIAVGGGACRVQLACHHASGFGLHNFFGWQIVSEVQSHERFKINALRHCSQDA